MPNNLQSQAVFTSDPWLALITIPAASLADARYWFNALNYSGTDDDLNSIPPEPLWQTPQGDLVGATAGLVDDKVLITGLGELPIPQGKNIDTAAIARIQPKIRVYTSANLPLTRNNLRNDVNIIRVGAGENALQLIFAAGLIRIPIIP